MPFNFFEGLGFFVESLLELCRLRVESVDVGPLLLQQGLVVYCEHSGSKECDDFIHPYFSVHCGYVRSVDEC